MSKLAILAASRKNTPASWTPASLGSALVIWLPPSNITLGANGDFPDASGNGYDFISSTPGAPAFSTLKNGLPGYNNTAVGADVTVTCNQTMDRQGLGPGELHYFLVCKQNGDGGSNAAGAGTTPSNPSYLRDQADGFGVYQHTVGGVDTLQVTAITSGFPVLVIPNTRTVMCIEFWFTVASPCMHVRVAGGTVVTDPGGTAWDGGSGALAYGFDSIGGELACSIGEFFIANRALTAPEQTQARTYISNKWGIAT